MRYFLAIILLASSFFGSAGATDVRFIGSGDFIINGDNTVTVNFDEVRNFDATFDSGTIYLILRANLTNDPFGSGYEVSSISMLDFPNIFPSGILPRNSSYTDITYTTAYNAPPSGYYYYFLHVVEWPDLNISLDSVPAVNNPLFSDGGTSGGGSGGGDGGGGGGGGGGDLELLCPCAYEMQGDFINLQIDEIQNNRNGGTSGTLMVKLFATNSRYDGGTLNGFTVAERRFDPLDGGFLYRDIDLDLSLSDPPPGSYYMTLALLEFDGEFFIMDYVTFQNQQSFSGGVTTTPPPPTITDGGSTTTTTTTTTTTSDDGGSGGLAFDLRFGSFAMALLLISLYRKRGN